MEYFFYTRLVKEVFQQRLAHGLESIFFPGGYIPSLSDIIIEAQKLNINITDVEILRLHYAHTLSHWYKIFKSIKRK